MDAFVLEAMKPPAHAPARRRLAEASFFCVGSCFATNVAWHLSRLGARIHTTVLAESINSPRNNVDLFHYLDTGERRGLLLRDDIRELAALDEIRAAFLASDTLVLTLGCAYSLVSGATGEPLSRLEPGARFGRPTASSVAASLAGIVDTCEARGFRDIFMTVSPVPLAGTLAHDQNPFVSDAASMAILRAARLSRAAACGTSRPRAGSARPRRRARTPRPRRSPPRARRGACDSRDPPRPCAAPG